MKALTIGQEVRSRFGWMFSTLPFRVGPQSIDAKLLDLLCYSFASCSHAIAPNLVYLAAKSNSITPPGPLRDLAM